MNRDDYFELLQMRRDEIAASMLGLARNDKVATSEFRTLSIRHAIFTSLGSLDGGTSEQQVESVRLLRKLETAS